MLRKFFWFSGACIFILFPAFFSGCGNGADISGDTIDITYRKGNANASVVITEYSEYQCEFCAQLTFDVLPELQKDYIETGKVLFVFKDFPLSSKPDSQKASEAAYCAGEQNEERFWDMHVKLFENNQNLSHDYLIRYAEEIGLNVPAFTSCLDSNKYKNLVLRNRGEGEDRNVGATPTIFVNDEKLFGVQPYENFVKVIEAELVKAQGS